jgi:fido (protein-threonine AMPylation protein)
VVQPCSVTLDPVTTRLSEAVRRHFIADYKLPEADELEMPEDDSTEALPEVIDAVTVVVEALALSLPLYPRAAGVELGEAVFTEPGLAPLREGDLKPFAALAGLVLKAKDSDKARRQRLALAHMATEAQIEQLSPQWTTERVWAAETVQDIHQDLFARLPQADRLVSGQKGSGLESSWVIPGALRRSEVSVGRHAAPGAAALPGFMARWSEVYGRTRRGEMQLISMAAAHQRLTWIRPFLDGNGRVARLQSHLVLTHMGLSNGMWSPLRGFARSQEAYYAHLAAADEPRAGDLDGRGNLSEAGLLAWIGYVLDACLDQVSFMSQALSLADMKSRIAACLAYEEKVVRQGVRSESLRALHYLFASQAELDRGDF